VDSSGLPDDSIDQYRVVTGGSIAVGPITTGLITSDGTDGGTKRSVTQGDYLAVVMEWDSTQSGQVWLYGLTNNANSSVAATPWGASHNGTSWTIRAHQGYLNLALEYDDGTYSQIGNVYPATSGSVVTYNDSSTPDERALIFTFPFDVEVTGAWFWIDLDSDMDLVLYDSDGSTVLETLSLAGNFRPFNTQERRFVKFAGSHVLTGGDTYRLAAKPTSGSNISLGQFTVSAAAVLGAWDGGTDFYLSTRTDGGSWTETTTTRPFMGLVIRGLDTTGVGGGGAVETAYPF
jgi:hypothetical protein